MKRVLVTGASGFIGRHLCRRLQERGVRVHALSRMPAEGPWDEMVICNLEEGGVPDGAMEGVDTVFHLAARVHQLDEAINTEKAYHQANVLATRDLLRAAERAGVERFVFFSSLSVMGEATKPGECQDESHEAIPVSLYGQSKLEAESLVRGAGIPHVCILRPAMVYGTGCKGNLPRMIGAMASGWFPPLPEVRNKRSMVHVDDVVDAALLAAGHSQAAGQIYIVTDGQGYSSRQLYEWICEAMHKPVPRWCIPLFMLKLMAMAGDIIGSLRGRRFIFDSDKLEKLAGSAYYSSAKIERELGFNAHHRLRDDLPEMARFLECM